MKNLYLSVRDYFFIPVNASLLKWFKKGLYVSLLLYTLTMVSEWELFYGAAAFEWQLEPFDSFEEKVANFLNMQHGEYALSVLIAFIVLLLLGIMGVFSSFVGEIIYILAVILFTRTHYINDSGSYVIQLMLFYSLFMREVTVVKKGIFDPVLKKKNDLQHLLNNFGVISVKIQLSIIYFVSAFVKLQGEKWGIGEGFYYSLNYDLYTHPMWQSFFYSSDILLYGVNYFILIFQFAFPFLIWMKRTKKTMVIIGLLLHISILFVNGITFFSIFMMASYLIFLDSFLPFFEFLKSKKWLIKKVAYKQ